MVNELKTCNYGDLQPRIGFCVTQECHGLRQQRTVAVSGRKNPDFHLKNPMFISWFWTSCSSARWDRVAENFQCCSARWDCVAENIPKTMIKKKCAAFMPYISFESQFFEYFFYVITTDLLPHNLTVQRQAPVCLSRILADHFNSQKRTFAAKGHLYFAYFSIFCMTKGISL